MKIIIFMIFIVIVILLLYFKLKTKSVFNSVYYFINNNRCGGYSKPKKYITHSYNIVTSCTTSPLRIFKMKETLNSLEKQTVSPTYIILNLPYVYARTNEQYVIPDYIQNNTNIVINRLEIDYGPATKLVGSILNIPKDEDTWIVVHDDDQLYFQNTIETYIKYINKIDNKKVAFTISGFSFSPDFTKIVRKSNDLSIIQLCEGFMSYCVHRSIFEDDFLPYIINLIKNKDCNLSDDLIISNYIAKKDVKIYKIHNENLNSDLYWSLGCELEYGKDTDALHVMANTDKIKDDPLGGHFPKYLRAIQYLKQNNMFYLN